MIQVHALTFVPTANYSAQEDSYSALRAQSIKIILIDPPNRLESRLLHLAVELSEMWANRKLALLGSEKEVDIHLSYAQYLFKSSQIELLEDCGAFSVSECSSSFGFDMINLGLPSRCRDIIGYLHYGINFNQ